MFSCSTDNKVKNEIKKDTWFIVPIGYQGTYLKKKAMRETQFKKYDPKHNSDQNCVPRLSVIYQDTYNNK